MNILPFVCAFLLIFSLLTHNFVAELRSSLLIESALHGYDHVEKTIHNALVKKKYHKIKTSPAPNEKGSGTKKQGFVSRREGKPPFETSKFHLRALCQGDIRLTQHPLYEPLASLLRDLYKERLFDKDSTLHQPEYALIQALHDKAQQQAASERLSDLYPDDPVLKALYYKMLKGTNTYTPTAGIAPLGHFLSLQKTTKGAVLGFASEPVLKALFGAALTADILQFEQARHAETGKNPLFTKQDLESLLLQEPSSAALLSELGAYLDESKQSAPQLRLAKRDRFSGIEIEKQL